uniref:Transthyretin-like family protein n=1 Tax=Strongyloides papillosus TaxID=174720 RepID=A0A0N5BDA2_STREA
MLFLGTILIYITIFSYQIVEASWLRSFYSTGISGTLVCSTDALKITVADVEIVKKSKHSSKYKTVVRKTIKLGARFHLEAHYGRFFRWNQPNLYMRFTYHCSRNKPSIYLNGRTSSISRKNPLSRGNSVEPCRKVYFLEIPKHFVIRGRTIHQHYGFDTLDLANVEGQVLPQTKKKSCLI